MDSLAKMTVTEEQAKDIFKYIASKLKCSDVKLSNYYISTNNILKMKDIDSRLWFTVFLVNDKGQYDFIHGNNYVSLLDKIIMFKYIVVNDKKYMIPKSLEEILIEMDLNG